MKRAFASHERLPLRARVSRFTRAIVLFGWLVACTSGAAKAPASVVEAKQGDVVNRIRATGRIVPREEVFVRSLVAGQLVQLRAKAGDVVEAGQHLGTVRIIADPVQLGEARAQVQLAEAKLTRASREHTRLSALKTGTSMSAREVAQAEDDERIARTELDSAKERQRLIAEGVAHAGAGRSTRIVATVGGTVLATPVAVGDFVSDMNSYRDGTTIAVLADMSKLLFKGQVEEAHVGSLHVGMPATVRVGALRDQVAEGKVAWIAPRASVEQSASGSGGAASGGGQTNSTIAPLTASTAGITRFEVWIELTNVLRDMRAGYTASAELELSRADGVVLVPEGVLRFDGKASFVRVVGKDGSVEERKVKLGVSDGAQVEVTEGLRVGERLAPYPEESVGPSL